MLVPVEAGENRVQITFIRTWDRTAGGWISALATVLVLVLLLRWPVIQRRQSDRDESVVTSQ
jgi:hypothetical protein